MFGTSQYTNYHLRVFRLNSGGSRSSSDRCCWVKMSPLAVWVANNLGYSITLKERPINYYVTVQNRHSTLLSTLDLYQKVSSTIVVGVAIDIESKHTMQLMHGYLELTAFACIRMRMRMCVRLCISAYMNTCTRWFRSNAVCIHPIEIGYI